MVKKKKIRNKKQRKTEERSEFSSVSVSREGGSTRSRED